MDNTTFQNVLRQLTPEQLLQRLSELEAEAKAIRIILRAVRARKNVPTDQPSSHAKQGGVQP